MLQRPFNINIRGQTLDGNDPIPVTWQVSGDISTAYQVKVYRNSDNVLTYDSGKLTSYAQNHTIPSKSLQNGLEYKIEVSIWNQPGASATSDREIFQTTSKPIIVMDTVDSVNSLHTTSQQPTVNQKTSLFDHGLCIYMTAIKQRYINPQ